MKIKYSIVTLLIFFTTQIYGADLLDLRVIPDYRTNTMHIDGYISKGEHQKKGFNREARFKLLYPRWMKSGTVELHVGKNIYPCNVSKGRFSTDVSRDKNEDIVSVYFRNKLLYSETFSFPDSFHYLLVSDIDDTILDSSILSFRQMVYKALFKKATKRKCIPGTKDLYSDLSNFASPLGHPLFIYLTGGTTALSRTVKKILKHNHFPSGVTIFKKSLWSRNTKEFKMLWLKFLAQRFSEKPFLLFGDSGQKDPFIYTSFALMYPKLVKGIIIHEVTNRPTRITALQNMKKQMAKKGIPFIFWVDINDLKKQMASANLL